MYQLDRPAGQISWTDQLNRSAGQISWTDQLDGSVLFIWSLGQFAYSKIHLSVCTLSQLRIPTKALFSSDSFQESLLTHSFLPHLAPLIFLLTFYPLHVCVLFMIWYQNNPKLLDLNSCCENLLVASKKFTNWIYCQLSANDGRTGWFMKQLSNWNYYYLFFQKVSIFNKWIQAGAELGQAQVNLVVIVEA